MKLRRKTALVVGGGTGIGRGIVESLAAEGCRAAIAGRRAEKLQEVADAWRGEDEILCHVADVADRASVLRLVEWALQKLDKIDILVNCAGVNIPNRTMEAMRPEDWDRVLQINATGAYNCMYAVLPSMRERSDGLIVNVSSVAGKRALPLGGVAYCASKFAQTALGTAVGLEVAKHNIRVTNIYPGEVNTPILENRPEPVSAERKAAMLQPEDLGATVAMIAALPPRAHVAELVIKPTVQEYL